MLFWPVMLLSMVIFGVAAYESEIVALAASIEPHMLRWAFIVLLVVALGARSLGGMTMDRVRRFSIAAVCLLTIGSSALVGYAFRNEAAFVVERVRGELMPSVAMSHSPGQVELRRHWDGHFRAGALVNGGPIEMMIDTGASMVLIPYERAAGLGIDPEALDFSLPVATANGQTAVAPLTLATIEVGPIVLQDVPAAVARPQMLAHPLLGMSFIERLTETTFRKDRLILTLGPGPHGETVSLEAASGDPSVR